MAEGAPSTEDTLGPPANVRERGLSRSGKRASFLYRADASFAMPQRAADKQSFQLSLSPSSHAFGGE